MFTTEVENWPQLMAKIKNVGPLTPETTEEIIRTLIPVNPVISYYNDKDELLYSSNSENVFCGIRLILVKQNVKGYYCTISTEWYDDNDEYHGTSGKRNYTKFYFNDDDSYAMSDWCAATFKAPYIFCRELSKLNYINTKLNGVNIQDNKDKKK